jgi:hypothetical protein
MAKSPARPTNLHRLVDEYLWECKDCHQTITAQQTVAYNLIEQILYGWCEPCFLSFTKGTRRSS